MSELIPLSWQSLWIRGLASSWLDCAHGFCEPPNLPFPIEKPVFVSARREFHPPAEMTLCLETEFCSVQLHSNEPARLNFYTPIPIGNPQALLPLTAALAQQWLLAGSLSLHAAAIKVKQRTLLVLGNSQAGKSTLVRSALQLGATVVSDDLVRLTVEPIFKDAQIIARSLRGFVRFRPVGEWPEECIWINSSDQRFAQSMAIDAVVFLDSAPREAQTAIGSISILEATAQLINQSAPLFLQRGFDIERANMLAFINRLLRQVPIIRVTTGFDILHTPEQAFARLLGAIWPNA